jgi:glycosyltransferase involved in cell wall biosynthesis
VNVLFVDQFSEMGGAQRCLLDLLPALVERGWEFSAAMPLSKPPGEAPLQAAFAARGATIHAISCGPYTSGAKTAADSLRFMQDLRRTSPILRRVVADAHIDVVYANGPRVLPAAARCGVPLVFHLHNRLTRKPDLWLVKRYVRRAMVLASCEFVAEPLRSTTNVHVIPNGTEDLGFAARNWGGTLRVGVVGRIAPEKGQWEFVETARILRSEGVQSRFVICGDAVLADPAYGNAARAASEGLSVEFPGWLPTPGAAIGTVDVLVVPSAAIDAVPRVILEAFCTGAPVVAYASGGIPELIEDGTTGFLVRKRTPEALAVTLKAALASPERLAGVARQAREVWQARHTVRRYRDQVLGLVEEALSRRRSQNNSAAKAATQPADKRVAG